MAANLKPDTLDFILDHTKAGPEAQLRDAEVLDTKMMHIFSTASVVMGLAGLSTGKIINDRFATYLLAAALVAYLLTALCAFRHLWIRQLHRAFQADVLWERFWQDDVAEVKHSLVAKISDAYGHNKNVLTDKAQTILVALVTVALEVILIGIALIRPYWA